VKPKTSENGSKAASTTASGNRPHGSVIIRQEICKGCGFCIEFCPRRCLDFSQEFNAKGYHFPLLGRPEDCIGCDFCGSYCPDFAIHGFRLKGEVK
jgi:2-oxoglutarate ferredoxin oxidoreductase subunit delta